MGLDAKQNLQRLVRVAVRCGPIAVLSALTVFPGAVLAANSSDAGRASAALRRACATGALTPYTCAQHGIKVDGPTAAASPASPAAQPAPSAVAGSAAQSASSAGTFAATPVRSLTAPTAKSASERVTASSRSRAKKTDDVSGSLRLYSDTQGRYTINIPEGWTLTSERGFPSLRNGEAWIQLRDEPGVDAEAAGSAAMASLNGQFPSFKPVNAGPETYGHRPGYSMTLDAVSRAGRKSALVIVTAPEGSGQYVAIVGGASAEDAGTVSSGVGAIAKSLWFKSR